MKHLVLTAVVFGLLGWLAVDSQACHRRGSCCGPETCSPCPAPSPVVAQAPPTPQFVEHKVTRYKCVQVEREITEIVCRLVPREEKCVYTVMVPVTKQEKRTHTCYVPVHKQVEYTCTVMVPVTVQEKRKVTECHMVSKEVEYKCTVLVPKVVERKKTVRYCELQKQLQECVVSVCKIVPVQCTDACGNCYTTCQRVCENQKVTREVCVPVWKTKEVVCHVTICEPVERICKKIVCLPVKVEKEIVCNVVRCEAQTRKMTKTICEMVPKTHEVICNVVTCQPEQRHGTRTVYDTKRETVVRKILCNEMQPYTEIVRVPVVCGK